MQSGTVIYNTCLRLENPKWVRDFSCLYVANLFFADDCCTKSSFEDK